MYDLFELGFIGKRRIFRKYEMSYPSLKFLNFQETMYTSYLEPEVVC